MIRVTRVLDRFGPRTGLEHIRERFAAFRLFSSAALLAIFLISAVARIAALDPTSHIRQYGHTAWRLQDGYFGSQPYSIAQTKDGYIWVGTRDGLFRFDGVRFMRWDSASGKRLPSAFVISLLGARDGSLWIGTDAGLAHLVNNRLIAYPNGEGWFVGFVLEDREGRIWIDRERSDDKIHPLCQVLDTGVRCHGKEDGVDAFSSGPISQDASGALWVGSGTTLVRWREGDSQVYRPKSLMSNAGQAGITGLAAESDGSLWVGFEMRGRGAGLQRMIAGNLRPFVAPGLNGETLSVNVLMLDRENSLWVGTDEGIYKVRSAEVDHFGTEDGLSSNSVNKFLEDREGNLWLVSSQGVDMFRDFRVKSISIPEGRGEGEVQSLLATRDGKVLIGTSRLQVLGTDGVSSELKTTLHGNMVTCLLEDHAGRLWAGMDNTLSVDEGGGFRPITRWDGSPVGMVTGITEDSENNIGIESRRPQGTLMRIRDLAVQQEFPSPEMPFAIRLVADPQRGIWLGLANGDLARYRSGRLTTFSFGDHPRTRVQAMVERSDDSILGATGFGVVAWRSGKQQILTTRNGLPCNGVNALIADEERNQWLYMQCGLVEIPKDEMGRWWEHPEAKLKLKVFDALDGVRPGFGNFSNSARTPDGRLWFANGSVVQVIEPARIGTKSAPPPVYVDDVIADRKTYPINEAIRLPALTRDVQVDYTALSYAVPQKVFFRYRLEGRDAKWQEPGTRRQAFYTDLGPGHYRFRVIACNDDGVWNETGASMNFSIAPAYYQTAWFRFLCAGVLVGLLGALYQIRLRQVRRQFAAGLEERVNERTRIARELHDTLLQSFQGVAFQLQASRKLLLRKADNAQGVLDEAILATEEAIREGRSAIRDLRPEPATQRNLPELLNAAGLEQPAAQEPNRQAPNYRVLVEGAQRDLPPMLQDEVYRIAREVIRNAFLHASAGLVEVEIRYDEDQLRLRVRDDGRGIDPKILEDGGKSGHFGIPGMRERTQRIGARLNFWSEIGAGTEVELTVSASMAYPKKRNGDWLRWFRRAGKDG